jgi:hypothetical protein
MPLYKQPEHGYSSVEHIVGKWINGATLYEKTVDCGAMPNAATKSIAHGITGAAIFFITEGFFIASTTSIPMPFASGTSFAYNANVYISGDNILAFAGVDRSAYTLYVTIRYTKT